MPVVEPLRTYLERIARASDAPFEERLRALAAAAGRADFDPAAELARMRAYLVRYYEGVEPVSAHVDEGGRVVDCIPFDQQPAARSARAAGHELLAGPPPAAMVPGEEAAPEADASARPSGPCPPGMVGLPRVTLERLVEFGTLDDSFRKFPGGGGGGPV